MFWENQLGPVANGHPAIYVMDVEIQTICHSKVHSEGDVLISWAHSQHHVRYTASSRYRCLFTHFYMSTVKAGPYQSMTYAQINDDSIILTSSVNNVHVLYAGVHALTVDMQKCVNKQRYLLDAVRWTSPTYSVMHASKLANVHIF